MFNIVICEFGCFAFSSFLTIIKQNAIVARDQNMIIKSIFFLVNQFLLKTFAINSEIIYY